MKARVLNGKMYGGWLRSYPAREFKNGIHIQIGTDVWVSIKRRKDSSMHTVRVYAPLDVEVTESLAPHEEDQPK